MKPSMTRRMLSVKTGKYFAFEGIDGVGKTTTLKLVAEQLAIAGVDFVLTKEPGGPAALFEEWGRPHGLTRHFGTAYKGFRPLCVDNPQIPARAKRALYRADAFYNWETVVLPALAAGKLVLSDRTWVSDLAYGTVLTGVSLDSLLQFNLSLIPEMLEATNVVYLTLPEEEREARLAVNMADAMDTLGRDIRNKIADGYEQVFNRYLRGLRVAKFSTLGAPDEVAAEIVGHLLA